MVNRNLTWEEPRVTNIGIDMGFFRNKLSFEIDYYDRLTSGMIRPSELSNLLTGAYTALEGILVTSEIEALKVISLGAIGKPISFTRSILMHHTIEMYWKNGINVLIEGGYF